MRVYIPEAINIVRVQAFSLTFKSFLVSPCHTPLPRPIPALLSVGQFAFSSMFSKWHREKCHFSHVLFSLILWLSIVVLIFIYIGVVLWFVPLCWREYSLHLFTYSDLCVHSPVDGHLACFQVLAATDKAAVSFHLWSWCGHGSFSFWVTTGVLGWLAW